MANHEKAQRPPRSLLSKLRGLSFTSALAGRQPVQRRPKATGSSLEDIRCLTAARALARVEALEPDAAWAVYVTLPVAMKEHIAERLSTARWGALFVREIEAQALARAKSEALAAPVHAGYFEFKRIRVACGVCGWEGLGGECSVSESSEAGELTSYVCPGCSHDLAVVTRPTLQAQYDHWGELSKAERAYVFQLEREQEACPAGGTVDD